jgi:hypothetical protein
MIEAKFFLGTLETFLDGPAQPCRPSEFGEAGAGRSCVISQTATRR